MMRYSKSEKMAIIRLVERSELPVKRTLEELGIARSTFYAWYKRYQEGGFDGLAEQRFRPQRTWNQIPDESPYQVYAALLDAQQYYCSVSTMYRILAEHDQVRERRNQLQHCMGCWTFVFDQP
jgi:transposase-like protein